MLNTPSSFPPAAELTALYIDIESISVKNAGSFNTLKLKSLLRKSVSSNSIFTGTITFSGTSP